MATHRKRLEEQLYPNVTYSPLREEEVKGEEKDSWIQKIFQKWTVPHFLMSSTLWAFCACLGIATTFSVFIVHAEFLLLIVLLSFLRMLQGVTVGLVIFVGGALWVKASEEIIDYGLVSIWSTIAGINLFTGLCILCSIKHDTLWLSIVEEVIIIFNFAFTIGNIRDMPSPISYCARFRVPILAVNLISMGALWLSMAGYGVTVTPWFIVMLAISCVSSIAWLICYMYEVSSLDFVTSTSAAGATAFAVYEAKLVADMKA